MTEENTKDTQELIEEPITKLDEAEDTLLSYFDNSMTAMDNRVLIKFRKWIYDLEESKYVMEINVGSEKQSQVILDDYSMSMLLSNVINAINAGND